MSTPITEPLGINLGNMYHVPSDVLNPVETRLRELLKYNQNEWEPYATEDEIIFRVRTGQWLLWVAPKITLFDVFMMGYASELRVGTRTFIIACAAGPEVIRYMPAMVDAAKLAAKVFHCTRIEMVGRDAWARLLAGYGVHSVSRTYAMEL